MFTKYDNTHILFTVGSYTVRVLNLVREDSCRTIPNHTHGDNSYEIHYICDGCGQAQIDRRSYDLTPGTLYVVGAFIEHSQTPCPDDRMHEYCIHIHFQRKKSAEKQNNSKETEYLLSLFEQTFFWFGSDKQNLFPCICELFRCVERKTPGYQFEAEAFLRQILIRVIRNYLPAAEKKQDKSAPPAFDKYAVTIEEYFLYEYQNLSLEELSRRLGLSPRQTERLLKYQYGMTFQQKKTQARMSAAAMMLVNTADSIGFISESIGYSSLEHFSAAFRKYYGISPTAYRNNPFRPAAGHTP